MKSLQAAGAIEEVTVITREMTMVDVRRGEQWRWMNDKNMSNAPVVVAETALTLSRGSPLGWVSIRRKNSSAYEERPQIQGSVEIISHGNQTYPDFVYEALQRPQREIDNQNSHCCDDRHAVDWKRTPGSQRR